MLKTIKRLSILAAGLLTICSLRYCSTFQHLEQAVPFPSDGRHACSRRCQLAFDLTVRGTGHLHLPYTLWETATWLVLLLFCFRICCFTWKHICSNFATFHLVVADRRATARTTNLLSHAASRPKKKLIVNYTSIHFTSLDHLFLRHRSFPLGSKF